MGKEFWLEYWERVKAMAFGFDWSYVVEIIAFAAAFYIAFKILKENKGGKIIALFVAAVIGFGLAFSLSSAVGSEILVLVIFLLVIFVPTMFHTEIKRTLLGSGTKKHSKGEGMTVRDIEFIIDEITHAVQHMSKNDIGALIVLSNGNLPEGIISSGTIINADINAPMIEAVFYPKAPLHDGAMVILGDKIQAAGCFLPLTQREFPKDYGTRHRAGIGVTEVADVSTIIVSEETGIVSVVKLGKITRYIYSENLKRFLREYYWKEFNTERKR